MVVLRRSIGGPVRIRRELFHVGQQADERIRWYGFKLHANTLSNRKVDWTIRDERESIEVLP